MTRTKFEDTYIQEMEQRLRDQNKFNQENKSKFKYNSLDEKDFPKADFESYRKTRPQDVEILPLD